MTSSEKETPLPTDVAANLAELNRDYQTFCETQYAEWRRANPPVMPFFYSGAVWFDRIEEQHKAWCDFIEKQAVAWWRERGFLISMPRLGPPALLPAAAVHAQDVEAAEGVSYAR